MRVWEKTNWSPGEDRTFAAVRVVGSRRLPLPRECEVDVPAMCAA
jgi:hypothetical protein